jgi:hypothetical protein
VNLTLVYRGGIMDGTETLWEKGDTYPPERIAFSFDGVLDWWEYKRNVHAEYTLSGTRLIYEIQP